MILSLQFMKSRFISTNGDTHSLANSLLLGHNQNNKDNALDAVDILIKYKTTVHDFTDDIIAFWPLPQQVMARYRFDDAEQLNEWLDRLY